MTVSAHKNATAEAKALRSTTKLSRPRSPASVFGFIRSVNAWTNADVSHLQFIKTGDGNCLFRALCDQLYGSPKEHLVLRREICEWMDVHREHYQGFVEDGRTWAQHVGSMRQTGTYGGHLELCAFAHLKHRNVKVIQPGLVYVIEWSTGPNAEDVAPSEEPQSTGASSSTSDPIDAGLSSRDQRRARRDRVKERAQYSAAQAPKSAPAAGREPDLPALYVAYHDWEHFSSVRNISGPHQGIPNVVETTAPASDNDADELPPPASSARRRTQKVASHLQPPSNAITPDVRSPSPSTATTTSTQNTDLSSSLSSGPPRTPPESTIANAAHAIFSSRSPKRSFEESDDVANNAGGEEGSGSEYGRASTKRTRPRGLSVNQDIVDEAGEPEAAASSEDEGEGEEDDDDGSGYSSVCSSSAAPSPVPPVRRPNLRTPAQQPPPAMTKRERKRLGKAGVAVSPPRPKPKRVILLLGKKGDRSKESSASSKTGSVKAGEEDAKDGKAEWMSNGSGKMDVRGFRELKI
ncbi:hypothetical protein FRB94_002051 [Tulasnella sp. JGI-2019a]|nr:hypothetical protein FRB94_002051 [Tulasnella sp. JGI-2019a]